MDEINKWIYTIVAAMVFSTLVEIIMPNNSMKKYTKLVLGFLLMTIILQPVLRFLKNDTSFSNYSFKYQNQLESSYLKDKSNEYNLQQSKEITKQYKLNLQNQMGQYLKNVTGNNSIKVDVEVVDDTKSENYGEIKKVSVMMQDDGSVSKVQKIEIGKKEDKAVNSGNNDKTNRDLKEVIVSAYGIEPDAIEIRVIK